MPLDSRLLTAEPIARAPGWTDPPGQRGKFKLTRGYEPIPTPSSSVGVGADEDRPNALQDPAKALLFAQSQVGRPYSGPLSRIGGGRFGDPGYDCSSFVSAAYRELGINLTPFTDAAANQTRRISNEEARPGDIVFYRYRDPSQPGVTYPHMAIYLGEGQMIDAGYNTGVSVRPLLNLPYEIRRAPGVNPTAVLPAAADQAQIAAAAPTPGSAPPAAAQGQSAFDAGLARVERTARDLGFDDEATRIFRSIARIEGGVTGNVGDNGRAFGAFQFNTGGQLANFARSRGLTPQQAGELLQREPFAGVEWAMNGYLGQALAAGRQRGLTGAELATYVQQYGQVSQNPQKAGQTYQTERLTTQAGPAPVPFSQRPQIGPSIFEPEQPKPWIPSPDAPGWDVAARGYERQFNVNPFEAERAVRLPSTENELAWRESALGMVRAGEPITAAQDYFAAADRYAREFGENLDWNQYFEDPGTYGYVEAAMGMSRDQTPEGEWAPEPEPWVEPWDEEQNQEEDLGWGQDVGAGQDVGVGEEWWEWGPFDEIGQFGRNVAGAFGGAFLGEQQPQDSWLSAEEEQRRQREMEQMYGWGNPIEHLRNRWEDATSGQAGLYETLVLGGLARAGGLGLNLATDVAQGLTEGFQYGSGVARGLGDVIGAPIGRALHGPLVDIFGEEAIRQQAREAGFTGQGTWETTDFGALGGVRRSPIAQDLGDVFDPTQAQARYEARQSPLTQSLTELALGDKGLGTLGQAAREARVTREVAGRLQKIAETGSWIERKDVPTDLGWREDLGNQIMENFAEIHAATLFPTLGGMVGGISAAVLSQDEETTWPEYARNMAVGAGLGAVAGLVGWKSASIAAKALTEGASEFRILNYGEDTNPAEFERLLKKKFGKELDEADEQGKRGLIERIHVDALNRGVNLDLDNAPGAVGSKPFLDSMFNRAKQAWVDRFAVWDQLDDQFAGTLASLSEKSIDDIKRDGTMSDTVRAAANVAATAANVFKSTFTGMLHQKVGRNGEAIADWSRYFQGPAVALQRALGTMSDDVVDIAELEPHILKNLGVDDRYVTDLLEKQARYDDLAGQWVDARRQADAGQLTLAGVGPAGMETRAGSEMLSRLAPLEDAFGQAKDELDLAKGTLEALVDMNGGLPDRAHRAREVMARMTAGEETYQRVQGFEQIGARRRPGWQERIVREGEERYAGDLGDLVAAERMRQGPEGRWSPERTSRRPEGMWSPEGEWIPRRPERAGLNLPIGEEPYEAFQRGEGFQATGPRIQTLPEAINNFATAVKIAEDKYGPGRATDWLDAALSWQLRLRPQLDELEREGGLARGTIEKVYRENAVYGSIGAITDNVDNMRVNGWVHHGMIVDDRAIHEAYSTDKLVQFNEELNYRHVEKILTATANQRIYNTLKRYAERDPVKDANGVSEFSKALFRPFDGPLPENAAELEKAARNRKIPLGPTEDLPRGWGFYSGLDEGVAKNYLMPLEIRDTLIAATPGQVDTMLRVLGTVSQPFRMGVTILSFPFVVGNIFRDFQTGIQNSKYPMGFLRNYMSGSLDVAAHGLDDFIAQNRGNKYVEDLPQAISKSLHNFFGEGFGPAVDAVRLSTNRALANTIGDFSETKVAGALADRIWGPMGRQAGEFLMGGGVTSALTPELRGLEGAAATYGFGARHDSNAIPLVGGLGHVIRTPADLMGAFALSAELTGRVAVYRSMLEARDKAGHLLETPFSASMGARSVLTDFSRGGQWAKALSVLFPLVNARFQGSLRSAQAAQDDPQGFATRVTLGAAVPAMALYAYNRMLYSDLYDGIAQYEKDKNFILIYGSLKDDRDPQGKERALYFKIPKNDVSALVANPIEHVMDAKFHVLHGKRDLKEDERTERSAGQMWLTQVASMLPISLAPDSLANNTAWFNSFIAAQPALGTAFQLGANYDQFRNRPIVPDEQLLVAKEFRRGADGAEAPWAAKLLAKWMGDLNLPEGLKLAPPEVAFAVSHLGGTAASMVMYAPDLLWEKFAERGLPVPDQMKPTTLEDLQLPPGVDAKTAELYLNGLQQTDIRPWQVRFVSRVFGMGGGGQSVTQKVKQLSTQEQTIWAETVAFDHKLELARYEARQEKDKLYADPTLTAREVYERRDAINKALVGRQEQVARDHPTALRDPAARKAFMEALPGVPINVDEFRPSTLPAEVPVTTLVSRYQNPPGVDLTTLNPLAQQQARSQELRRMSREFDVPTSVLRDYIAAELMNNEIPVLPGLKAVELDELVNVYMRPPGEYDPRDMREVALRRRVEVHKASQTLGIPEEQLLERLNVRLLSLQATSPLELSLEHAQALRGEVLDPVKFPKFADNQGNPVGMEQEWDLWEKELNYVKAQFPGDPRRWPEHIRAYDMAKANADIKRQQALFADPHYLDYALWFGQGQDMTAREWQRYVTGEVPRYSDGPGTAESARRDGVIRQYNMLPAQHPVKAQLRVEAQRYKRLAVKGWRESMLIDDLGNRMQDLDELYAQLQ